jgi:HD-GYP domain-containing protein (c-di-GMP phosphodiesterase class II)
MQHISLRKIFASLMLVSTVVLIILLYLNSNYEKKVVYYNDFVSMSVAITTSLDDIEKNYYRAFTQNAGESNEIKYIDESFNIIALAIKKAEKKGIAESAIDTSLVPELKMHIATLKEVFKKADTYNATSIPSVINRIEKIKALSMAIRQDAVLVIRDNNLRSGILNKMMVVYDIFILIIIFFIVDFQLLRPITKFRKIIEKRLEINEISPPQIAMGNRHELGRFVEKINLFTDRLTVINELNSKIYAQRDFDEVVDYVFKACKPFLPYKRFAIAIISDDGKFIKSIRAKAEYSVILGRNYQEPLSNSSLSDVIRTKKIRIINDLETYLEEHPHSVSTSKIVEEGMKSSMTVPLVLEQQVVGVVFFSSDEKNSYCEAHSKFVYNLTNALAIAFEKSFVFDDLILASVKGFAKIVESKDHVTGNHIDRMSIYSKFIADCLYEDRLFLKVVDETYIEKIYKFSSLHDIGKVGISEAILNKPAKLTDVEFETMKQHTLIGFNVLVDMTSGMFVNKKDYFKVASEIAKSHHEHYDGRGYPEGLSGEKIPLSARIVAIADVFDALTNVRPYKEAYSFEEALKMIFKESGTHFDPMIIESIKRHLGALKMLYESLRDEE